APAGRATTDEHRVVVLGEQRLQRFDAAAADEVHAEAEDVTGLLVDDVLGQAEARYLGAHETARLRVGLEHGHVVAEGREVARDGERGGSGADAGDALAVALRGRFR